MGVLGSPLAGGTLLKLPGLVRAREEGVDRSRTEPIEMWMEPLVKEA